MTADSRGSAPGRTVIAAMALTLASTLSACGGGSGGQATPTATEDGVRVTVEASDLALGLNRFLLALTDAQGSELLGASLDLRFFLIEPASNDHKMIKSSLSASAIEAVSPYTHTHADGTVVSHEAGETNVHLANVAFDAAGEWIVEVTGSVAGERLSPLEVGFEVRRESLTPGVGEFAPPSQQPVLADVDSIEEIDFSEPPNPETHTMAIADAVASGRPTVIAFASAGVCTDALCGPVKETFDALWEARRELANFIHVEPYAPGADGHDILPWIADEWGVQDQPWIFVVDSDGIVAAKFQAAVGLEELEAALLAVADGRDSS